MNNYDTNNDDDNKNDSPRMVVLKVKIVQECKESNVEIYKLIWGLVFKCNGSGIQFNTI
jgi:hypothetical protein